jgi:hypothetical protein
MCPIDLYYSDNRQRTILTYEEFMALRKKREVALAKALDLVLAIGDTICNMFCIPHRCDDIF